LLLLNSESRTSLCQELILMYPGLISDVYTEEPYTGENLLHIAIVNRNYEMVQWLVNKDPELLNGRATGAFFGASGKAYFGEFALSFAACTNQSHMVKFLFDKGADIYATDTNGNTALHMTVQWRLKEMYAFIEKIGEAEGFKDLSMIRNFPGKGQASVQGLTCMQLAVANNDQEMFDWILERKREIQWIYGRVSSSLVPLEEIDWVRGKEMGAVEWIVELNYRDLLKSDRINFLLDLKWDRFANSIFKNRFYKSLCFLAGFTLLTLRGGSYQFHGDKASFYENTETIVLGVMELVLCLGTASKLFEECVELYTEGLGTYLLPRCAIENVCSFSACMFFLCSRPLKVYLAMAVGERDVMLSIIVTLMEAGVSIAAWLYMLWFLLGNRTTGHFIVMIYKMIILDIMYDQLALRQMGGLCSGAYGTVHPCRLETSRHVCLITCLSQTSTHALGLFRSLAYRWVCCLHMAVASRHATNTAGPSPL
jgi:hypothetical protein